MKYTEFTEGSWKGSPPLLVAGGDEYQCSEVLAKARKAIIGASDEETEILHEKMESPKQTLFEALERFSVFGLWGEIRLIEYFLESTPTDKEKDALLKIAQGEASGNFLLIRTVGLRQSNWLKELVTHVCYVDCQLGKVSKTETCTWLLNLAQSRNIRLARDAAFEMIDRVGNQTGILENAITLMELSAQGAEQWNIQRVRDFFFQETQGNVFELADALANQDLKRSLTLMNWFFGRGVKVVELIGGLRLQFRRLLLLKLNQGKWSKMEGIKNMGIPPYFYDKTVRQSDLFKLQKLKKIYAELYNLDRDSKILSDREEDMFEMFILKLFFST